MDEKPQLIEQTAKRYKATQAAGAAGVGLATCIVIAGGTTGVTVLVYLGCLAFCFSTAAYMAGRFLAWWYHG